MRRLISLFTVALMTVSAITVLPLTSTPAHAVVHEIVAAYCSGGDHGAIDGNGFLEPPGLSDPNKKNFARPVIANGAVEGTFPDIVITDKPAAKFEQGTNAITGLSAASANHPSAEHCPKNALP
jgi:hypothetical protein